MADTIILPKLSIVAVSYNSSAQLPGLLDSLADGLQGIDSFEVIIADNASSDDSVAVARAHPINPTIVAMGRNAGYAAGINAAAGLIGPDVDMLILNPDVRLLPGAARQLQERLAREAVGVAVPKIFDEGETLAFSLRREPSLVTAWSDAIFGSRLAAKLGLGEIVSDVDLYRRGGPIEWATGAAVAVAARTRVQVGDWDESFFLYSEEVDFLRRVRNEGFSVELVPGARAVHIGGEYHRNRRLSHLMTANRIRYFRRYHGAVASFIFRIAILAASAARAALGPGHRAALQASLERWQTPPESLAVPGVRPTIVNRSRP